MGLFSFTESPFQVLFCFDQVIEKLEATAADPTSADADRAQSLLHDIIPYPELRNGISETSPVLQNSSLINRLMVDYFPPALTNNEIKAINLPYAELTFNHTERFKKILAAAGPDFKINIRDFDQHKFYVMSCCFILNAYFGKQLDFSTPLFYDIPSDGITRHYRILYNGEFLDILPTPGAPALTNADIEELMDNYHNLDLWKAKFPPESWILKGFAIMNLFDATVENAVSLLKGKLLGLKPTGSQGSIETIFRSIYKIPDLRIGFSIFDEDTENLSVNNFDQQLTSFIISDNDCTGACSALCETSYESLIKEKVFFTVSDTLISREAGRGSKMVNHLFKQGIRSFILAPIVKNDRILGVLEIVSPRAGELNTINANKLDIVMPFLTDSVERIVSQLQNQVEAVIQENYTSIHASVYWKFRDEARRLISHLHGGEVYTLPEITFPGVYPLYGQIDIKGSSETRNASVKSDITLQLTSLLELLGQIRAFGKSELSFPVEVHQVEAYLQGVMATLEAGSEQQITSYLETVVHPILHEISIPSLLPGIAAYLKERSKEVGSFHLHRREYETTITNLNLKLAAVLDHSQREAQTIFPHYYERFKTDGIEHNLYIGPTIAPQQEFTTSKLNDLRLWQVQAMCQMERAHYKFQPTLPYPVEVTTLILVHHSPIAIRFRMDEKRFDVDGSYNARYEIVKKRIDKAHIKGTKERITQPGMLTIVYSNPSDEQEYGHYIDLLVNQKLLQANSMEKLLVEDLQGVSGLKVLRVRFDHSGITQDSSNTAATSGKPAHISTNQPLLVTNR